MENKSEVYSASKIGFNNRGFTIIESLYGIVLLTLGSISLAALIGYQQSETRALTEKLTSRSLGRSIKRVLVSNDFCGCLLKNYTANATDPSNVTLNQVIPSIPSGFTDLTTCAAQPDFVVPPAGGYVSRSHMAIQSIEFVDGRKIGGSKFSGKIKVTLDKDSLVRPLRPIQIPMIFNVNFAGNPLSALPIASCGAGGMNGAPATCTSLGGVWDSILNQCSISPPTTQALCESMGGAWVGHSSRCYLAGDIYPLPAGWRTRCPAGFTSLGDAVREENINLREGVLMMRPHAKLCLKD